MPKPKSTAPAASSAVGNRKPLPIKQKVKVKKLKTKSQAYPPHVQLAVDPWSAPLEGAGRPDFNSEPTIPWKESWSQTFTTDANGSLYIEMMGTVDSCVRSRTTSLVTDPVVGPPVEVAMPNKATLTSTFTNFRPLCIAFEAEYIGEMQLCKGVLGVVKLNGLPSSNVDTFTTFTDETFYKETYASEKVAARLVFPEGDFQAITGTTNVGKIALLAIGLPASLPCVRVRFTACYEMQVLHSSLLSRDQSHTIAHPGQLATVASITGPSAVVATGIDPVAKLIQHGQKLVNVAGAINGLWQTSKPTLSLLAEYGSLLV